MRRPSFPLARSIALLLAMSSAAVGETDMTKLNDAERAAFRDEVRSYLLTNPEVLMEAIGVLEQQQAEAQSADDVTLVQVNAAAIFDDPTSFVGGNPAGDITVVEFADYNCGYCKKAHPEVSQLLETDGNIRFIVKEFPILGETSVLASRFALAVREVAGDDTYERVHDALMEGRGKITDARLDKMARNMGLDVSAVRAQMNSDKINTILTENHALAQRLQISGTPTFVIGDQLLRGYAPLDAMREIVADARADG
ncbi:DsbA family protein [Aliiroseovarius sp. PTFE2010]|uniref:DsbA family protein n=1 Tax=Aliiroseovarius sp. PTFE2010 TaxID=3417190 RepID=UPI003CEE136A